jgi:ABC-type transport system substrate-binding protein
LSCPARAFTDGRPTSIGIEGRVGQRNAPTILNALYNETQFWDGRVKTLEEQAALPVVNPIEMGRPAWTPRQPGSGPEHPLKAKVMISTSGSGQMVPLPMNEIIQQRVRPIGFALDFDVVDWGTMLVVKRSAPSAPASHGVDALNNSLGFADPASMFRYFSTTSFSPKGIDWGHFADARVDDLLTRAQESFDSEQQIELLAQAHAVVVEEAAWLFIVHDLNPRAMSPKVKGFQPAQS